MVCLSQISREGRGSWRQEADATGPADPGAIEQDADVVILMFREDYLPQRRAGPRAPKPSVAKPKLAWGNLER